MKYEIPRRIVPAMLGVLLAIPGCTGSESGTGPERHTVQHEPTVLAHMSGYNSGSTIVVYGSDGAWSVDVQNGQLTLPSGRKIQMPANFASSVATTFQAIADDKASQLETQLSSSCVTDPYSQVCIANSRLPQPRRDPEGDLRPRKAAASTGVLVRRMPSGPEGSQSPRHSSPGTRAPAGAGEESASGPAAGTRGRPRRTTRTSSPPRSACRGGRSGSRRGP
jgi:hypothetical protein